MIDLFGKNDWILIAKNLNNLLNSKIKRTGKQCRERFNNHLQQNIKKDEWTLEEEKILFSKHIILGNKWIEIAQFLPGRYTSF